MAPKRVRPRIDGDRIAELRNRLASTRLPDTLSPGWSRGVPGDWLSELLDDWRTFDVERFQLRLDSLEHFESVIDGRTIHFVHAAGDGPSAIPLLLTHGWPGSFCEYLELIPLLTNPPAGTAGPSFTVVAPSLPGFGFSGPPPEGGMTPDEVAEVWHRLMSDELGYSGYVAHGSDLGAGVTARLARSHPDSVRGIHLATPGLPQPTPPWSDAETRFLADEGAWNAREGAYQDLQSTKPSTLGVALADSPAGLAAWIGEKIIAWSSTREDGSAAFPRELLLSTLTLYLATQTIASSLLPYWAVRHATNTLTEGNVSPVPTSISIFGGERVPFPKPPRELAERYFTVVRWSEHDEGGHFPAVAAPAILADDLRAAFADLTPG